MYLKRSNTSKSWPIPRKGTKYLAMPRHNQSESISLIIVLRDILKLVQNKKELKSVLNEGKIKVNQKVVKETNYPLALFDIISIPEIKKNYKANLSKTKKFIFDEISEKEAESRPLKIINKKVLSKGLVQLNLINGRNILSKEKARTGDTVILNLKENKIIKIIPLEKGRNCFIIEGKHIGKEGKIEDLVKRGDKKLAKIIWNKEKINVWVKNIIVLE
jgi:small subunit ribosomal protein S4e